MIIRAEMDAIVGWTRVWFKADYFKLCADGVREHFGIGRRDKFVFCVSDSRPSDSDYYEIAEFFDDPFYQNGWRVADTEFLTGLTHSFGVWAYEHFPNAKRLYVWIEL